MKILSHLFFIMTIHGTNLKDFKLHSDLVNRKDGNGPGNKKDNHENDSENDQTRDFYINIDKSNIYGKFAVSSEIYIASEIGVNILKKGGNAVDAAISTCLAVGVINSFSSGLGGGGFMLVKKRGLENEAYTLDFRETAPKNIDIEDFKKDKSKSKVGGLAVGIPGEIKGLYTAHSKFGKLPWQVLFEEPIKLCDGFKATKELVKRINKFEKEIKNDPGLSEIYCRNGNLIKENDIVVRKNYKRTLIALSKDPKSFYEGKIADKIIDSINKAKGNVTKEDFKDYKCVERKTIVDKYKEYQVYAAGLPTSSILVLKALKILEQIDIDLLYKDSLKNNTYNHVHVLIEVIKFVMARRGELGDPDFIENSNKIMEDILSQENTQQIIDTIDINHVLPLEKYNLKKPSKEDHGTTHINVIDSEGLVVSLTSTINLEFGAKFMDKETGIILNNQMDDFYIPNIENAYNVEQTEENILKPGKRPFSSAAPIFLENDRMILVLGAAGGIRIPSSIIEVLFYLSLGKDLEEAISEPRMHHQLVPNILYVENNEKDEVVEFLEGVGHVIQKSKVNTIFTSLQGILQGKNKDGSTTIHAVSDYRKNGKSCGE